MQSPPPAVQPLATGTDFGLYAVLSVLGQGAFGIAYLARDKQLGRRVVIKEHAPGELCRREAESGELLPRPECAELYARSLRDFVQEAEVQAGLHLPGVPEVHEVFEAAGTAYVVLSYVEGEPLPRRLQEKPELRRLLPMVLAEALRVLGQLHRRGVLHRDLKPTHIILGESGAVHFIDFGAASSPSRAPLPVVSPPYSPPELNMPEEGSWSDLYALGAIFYELTLGEKVPPAAARLADEAEPLRLAGERALREEFPEAYLASLDRALAFDPKHRFADASQWLDALAGRAAPARTRRRVFGWGVAALLGLGVLYGSCKWWVADPLALTAGEVVQTSYALPGAVFTGAQGDFTPEWKGSCARIDLLGAEDLSEAHMPPLYRPFLNMSRSVDPARLSLVLEDNRGKVLARSMRHRYCAEERRLVFIFPQPIPALPEGWRMRLEYPSVAMMEGDSPTGQNERRVNRTQLPAQKAVFYSMQPQAQPDMNDAAAQRLFPQLSLPSVSEHRRADWAPEDVYALHTFAAAGYPTAARHLADYYAASGDAQQAALWKKTAEQWGLYLPPCHEGKNQ